ncbi:TIGR04063 family PEP-CTERM/XrtA system glycosyltransferase [Novosphingobium piscinae]|uniref:Glycosyltransferase, exosortase A system-associated n=1 Tax=Novosphingobium piscinae TaxID=1507448 RepID=A0A7X1G077_9SPHN|nr:TIGR04063 family PEP-CTERM/XrtA system glycosyltransferase [Novosphingobium piscinae]MBC2670238.1 glycosyltransferase, exosortase A system-associated [Novosphingobium piscinae]
MLRVLHILDHSLPLHSGYTFRTRAIMKAQQAAGIEVRGITGLRQGAAEAPLHDEDGLLFHRTPGLPGGPAGLREWREIAQLARAIEALGRDWLPDVLHAHSPALCGLAALRAGRNLDLPVVYEIRAFWEDAAVGNGTSRAGSLKYRLTRSLENRVVAGADAVVTICQGLRDDLIARGVPGSRITLSPNGVDLALFGTPAPRDAALAAELGLTGTAADGPVVGFIGSFYDYEGLDVLIEAMPALIAHHPGARLLLVGGGPMDSALRARAAASPAAGAIHFTGRVPHREVERWYGLMDIMAYPRKASRLTELVTPLKPLEAMAQGKIVAASAVGGHRELIADGVNGMLFSPDSAAACAAALADLADRRGEWDRLRINGRDHVRARHDWASNVSRYQAVYQTVLDARNRRHRLVAA